MNHTTAIRARETALITGGSSGIGAALAKLFAADGTDLVLVASDAQRLERCAEEIRSRHAVTVTILAADLRHCDAPDAIFGALEGKHLTVDYLVNNAGVGLLGDFAENALEDEVAMVRVNVEALVRLTKLALPSMLVRKRGGILNVSSLAARQPGGPGAAVYYATKAFVLSFSQGLGEELRGKGVAVTALCPGPTATGFGSRSGFEKTLPFNRFMTRGPEFVAQAGYRALRRGDPVCYPGLMARLFAFTSAALPRTPALALNRRFLRPRW